MASERIVSYERLTRLGQVGLGGASLVGVLVGMVLAIDGMWIAAAIAVALGAYGTYRVGWCWAHRLESDGEDLWWFAPFGNGRIPLNEVESARWRSVPLLMHSPVVVIKRRSGRPARVWFNRRLPDFFTDCGIPMTRRLRNW